MRMIKNLFIIVLVLLNSVALRAQNINSEEWYLQREDLDIFVKEVGYGSDTVIVVHGGFGANHDYMIDALKGLESKFHFILYDQRGSLLSYTKKENLTFQKNVDDLYALTKALKVKKVKLFCHSMGTLVGMEFAKQHPDLVSNLVLSGTILPKSDSVQSVFSERVNKQTDFLVNRKEVKDLLEIYKSKGFDSLRSVQDIEKSKLSHKDLTNYWRINFAAVNIYDMGKFKQVKGGRAYFKQEAGIMSKTVNWNYDYRKTLNENLRATIINGEYDFFDFQGEYLSKLLENYHKIDLKVIPDAGHNSWIDNPLLFRKYLAEALTK